MTLCLVGNKKTFAFETTRFEDRAPNRFLTIDIYVAGKRLTACDNAAYVPQFLGDIEGQVNFLKRDLSWLQYRQELRDMNLTEAHLHLARNEGWLGFLNWGPTTDDVSCHLIVFRDKLWMTAFLFSENPDWKTNPPVLHGASLSPFELVDTLEEQVQLMRQLAE